MILAIRSDKIESELYLCQDGNIIDEYKWEAHRQLADTIHLKIKDLLAKNKTTYNDISGLVAYKGPGSFTGLRIGITVFNTIAFSQKIPIVGCSGDDWLQQGLQLLTSSQNHNIVLPEYGGNANISTPKK